VLPQSDVRKAQAAFERLVGLNPVRLVPGHGRVTDLAQARRLQTPHQLDLGGSRHRLRFVL
jgi:hypothetical protein